MLWNSFVDISLMSSSTFATPKTASGSSFLRMPALSLSPRAQAGTGLLELSSSSVDSNSSRSGGLNLTFRRKPYHMFGMRRVSLPYAPVSHVSLLCDFICSFSAAWILKDAPHVPHSCGRASLCTVFTWRVLVCFCPNVCGHWGHLCLVGIVNVSFILTSRRWAQAEVVG